MPDIIYHPEEAGQVSPALLGFSPPLLPSIPNSVCTPAVPSCYARPPSFFYVSILCSGQVFSPLPRSFP